MPAWGVLLFGIIVTMIAAFSVKQATDLERAQQLAFAGQQIVAKIDERLASQTLMLRAAAGFLERPDMVSRHEWRNFVARLRAARAMKGVEGVGFAKLIPPENVTAHITSVRREGFSAYTIKPAGKRDLYSSIMFIEPFEGRNLRAFGYDMLSEPVRREAMERAVDSGKPALSGRVILVQENEHDPRPQPGMLIYAPVYRTGMPTATPAQRKDALVGWAYSPYRAGDLLGTLLDQWRTQTGGDIRIRIFDKSADDPANLLFESAGMVDRNPTTGIEQIRKMNISGRQWVLVFTPARPVDYALAWVTLGTGLLITGLLSALTASLIGRRERAEAMASELTGEIRARAAQLVQTEHRWRAALEGSDLGVWDWDIPSSTVYFSRRWKSMLGYTEDEIGTGLDEWERRVHPDDLSMVNAAVEAALQGKTTKYDCVHRVQCKNGSYKWVHDRGMVFDRAPDGSPIRMVGTHSDVDAQRQATIRAERHHHLYAALAACNAAIARRASAAELAQTVCSILVSEGGLTLAWIGFHNPQTGMIEPFSAAGRGQEYLDGIEISVRADDPRGQGPTGTAYREDKPSWVNDFTSDPRTLPWQDRAARYGWRGSAALPIRRKDAPTAVLTMYAGEAGFFDESTQALLNDMAAQFSLALDVLDAEDAARSYQADVVASERRYRAVLENSADGILVASLDGKILAANQAACDLLGLDEEQLQNLATGATFVRDEARYADLAKLLATHGKATTEITFVRADGSPFEVEVSASLYKEDEQTRRASVIFRDITDRKADQAKLAAQLAELERWYGSMLGRETRIRELKQEVNAALPEPRYTFIEADEDANNEASDAVASPENADQSESRIDAAARLALLNVIEDQKRAEERLRLSEERFRSMFEEAPLGIALMDTAEGKFLDVNAAYEPIVGWSRDELLDKRWQDITYPEDLEADLELALRFIAGEIPGYRFEKRYIRPDGNPVWVQMTISRLAFPGTDQRRHLCMIDDISERKRLAQAAAAEEAKFRALSEQSTVGIYMVNEDRISYVNPKAASMFGYSVEEMVGLRTTDLVSEIDRPRLVALRREREDHRVASMTAELEALRRDGSTFICYVDSQMTEIDGRPQVVGMLQDVTSRKQAEQEIRDYIERIEKMIFGTVDAISLMVELRDPYTAGHEQRVGQLSVAIAAEMGLSASIQHGLRLGGAVHDVGKLAVPAEILTKPGRLTPLEFEIVKEHAAQGYQVLKGIDSPWPLAEMAHQHHERIDGSGYPLGLKGEDVLRGAQVIGMADMLDAMTRDRPYQRAQTMDQALQVLLVSSGVLFDADLVQACVALFVQDGYRFPGP